MKFGITYDLKQDYLAMGFSTEQAAEFDGEDTIEAIEQALQKMGFETEKIGNIRHLTKALAKGRSWDMVFNICEGVSGFGREAQVPALLDAWDIPYVFSDPLIMSLTLHKAMTKIVVRYAGVPTPDFFVVENESDIDKIALPYPLFAKPMAEGTGKGITGKSIIRNAEELNRTCCWLLQEFKQPVLVERYLSGREFTVGIVGTGAKARTTGLMEMVMTQQAEHDFYSYENKSEYHENVSYSVPEPEMAERCFEVALNAWRALSCRDGGRIDIRCDDQDIPNFIEVNPLPGLNPIDSDLPMLSRFFGLNFQQLIEQIVHSALERINKIRQ
jgi:D-alanine-D-alanine ligase